MKALALTGTGGLQQVQVQELPEPTIQSPDQVLLRVQAIALNRLDLFVAQGLPGIAYRFPHVVGCDAAGTVQQVGAAVKQVRPGDRVMVNPTLSCGQCSACLEGEESLCATMRVLGEHCSGTAAEYVVVPAENLALVPPAMPWHRPRPFRSQP